MAKQLHRKFPTEQVKSSLERCHSTEIRIDYILMTPPGINGPRMQRKNSI